MRLPVTRIGSKLYTSTGAFRWWCDVLSGAIPAPTTVPTSAADDRELRAAGVVA